MAMVRGLRTVSLTARRGLGDARLEVQLQDARSFNYGGWVAAARLVHPAITGSALVTNRPLYGLFRSLTSGPTAAVAALFVFLIIGVWVVLLPGILLYWLLRRSQMKRLGLRALPDLATPASRRTIVVWATRDDLAGAAVPPSFLDAIATNGWFGTIEVHPGEVLFDRPFGYGRPELFDSFLDAALAVAEEINARRT
jgi:hypothetical protein